MDFEGEQRGETTHEATTDLEAKLVRKVGYCALLLPRSLTRAARRSSCATASSRKCTRWSSGTYSRMSGGNNNAVSRSTVTNLAVMPA